MATMTLRDFLARESSIPSADTLSSTSAQSETGPQSNSASESRLAIWLREHGPIAGGKGNTTAQTGATQALQQADTLGNQSAAAYGALMPELEAQAANPSGIAPADLAAQNTQAMQGAGGSQAAAVGQGKLQEARTKNPGSARAAIASSSRGAGEELGRRGLQIQTNNANVKNQQRSQALGEEGGVLGTTTGAIAPNFNATAANANANTEAENAGWDWAKYILDPAMAGSAAGAAAAAGQ